MNETPTLASTPPHRLFSLASLRNMIATWGERTRFRRELEQKLKDDPHLIADIGLTKREFEAEIAKPFWQGPMPPL